MAEVKAGDPFGLSEQLETALRGANKEINAAYAPPRHHNEGAPRFVALADKLYEAAIEAARHQVSRAENLLAEVEREAEMIRGKAKIKWDEVQTLERDLEDMSSELLQSFARYNGAVKK